MHHKQDWETFIYGMNLGIMSAGNLGIMSAGVLKSSKHTEHKTYSIDSFTLYDYQPDFAHKNRTL